MRGVSGDIIRLAYQNPGFRGALEPVLRKIAAMRREALRKKQLKKMLETDATFGVISAYRGGPKSENQARHGQLIRDLQKLGYKAIPLRGSWEGVTEKSVLVPRIKPGDLFDLGRKYNQDAVIHKSKDGVLGMYHTEGEPRAEVAVDPKGRPGYEIATDKSLYSKGRGLSFEFGFLWGEELPWDGKTPISHEKVQDFVESRKKKDDDEGGQEEDPRRVRGARRRREVPSPPNRQHGPLPVPPHSDADAALRAVGRAPLREFFCPTGLTLGPGARRPSLADPLAGTGLRFSP